MARLSKQQRHLVLLLVIIGASTPAAGNEIDSYIFEIPTTLATTAETPLASDIVATLQYANPEEAAIQLAATGGVEVLEVRKQQVVVGVATSATTTAAVDAADLADSFVIDYQEAAVSSSAALLRDTYGAQPTATDIEQFVFDYVDEKNYLGGFDFASVVASNRSGDCTEHAVLLAALARSQGLPARLALGVVIVVDGDHVGGFGHAWTEVYSDDRWQLFDATAPAGLETDEQRYYLPLMTLENEGPGYGMDFMRLLNVQPEAIGEIRSAQQ